MSEREASSGGWGRVWLVAMRVVRSRRGPHPLAPSPIAMGEGEIGASRAVGVRFGWERRCEARNELWGSLVGGSTGGPWAIVAERGVPC